MPAPRKCAYCGKVFTPQRANGKYCKPSHRTRASQTRGKLVVVSGGQQGIEGSPTSAVNDISAQLPPGDAAGILSATRKELEKIGALDSALGQVALQLAAKLQYVPETGAGTAALSRELRQVLDAAKGAATGGSDRLDEISKRRHQKHSAAGR